MSSKIWCNFRSLPNSTLIRLESSFNLHWEVNWAMEKCSLEFFNVGNWSLPNCIILESPEFICLPSCATLFASFLKCLVGLTWIRYNSILSNPLNNSLSSSSIASRFLCIAVHKVLRREYDVNCSLRINACSIRSHFRCSKGPAWSTTSLISNRMDTFFECCFFSEIPMTCGFFDIAIECWYEIKFILV